MSFFMNTFKYGIFCINLLFFFLGILLFYSSYEFLHDKILELDSIDKSFIYLCLFISATLILISFLGCCGTCYDNPCMIKSYALLILLCIVLQISVFFMISRIDSDKLGDVLKKEIIEKYETIKPEYQDIINSLQTTNECCGIYGPNDYKNLKKLPESCCNFDTNETCTVDKAFKKGCKSAINENFKSNKKSFYTVLGSALGIQFLIVIFSCVLSENIKEQYNIV